MKENSRKFGETRENLKKISEIFKKTREIFKKTREILKEFYENLQKFREILKENYKTLKKIHEFLSRKFVGISQRKKICEILIEIQEHLKKISDNLKIENSRKNFPGFRLWLTKHRFQSPEFS